MTNSMASVRAEIRSFRGFDITGLSLPGRPASLPVPADQALAQSRSRQKPPSGQANLPARRDRRAQPAAEMTIVISLPYMNPNYGIDFVYAPSSVDRHLGSPPNLVPWAEERTYFILTLLKAGKISKEPPLENH
jgi:hypothetical protein